MSDNPNESMSGNEDNVLSPSVDQHEQMIAIFAELGISEADGKDPEKFLASLQAVADKLKAQDAEIAKLTAAADKAKAAPKVSASRSQQPSRKIAPPKVKAGEEVPAPAVTTEAMDGLLEQIGEAETVEVAFSDGRSEIAGIPAREISGDAWRKSVAGLMLNGVDVLVHGPAHAQAPYQVHGYGLLLDGKQVAYRARPEVLNIGAGQTVNLSGDIIF